jgi:RimJ/RimL family protein N-acetyltransferase
VKSSDDAVTLNGQGAVQFISFSQISNALRSLFDADMPAGLRCLAILNGDATGRILTDDPVQPSYAIVQELADGTTYIGGSVTASILSQVVHTLRQDHDVVIGWWPDDPRLCLLPAHPDYEGTAIDFTHRPLDDDLSRFRQIPDGCHLQPVDHALFQRLAGHDWTVAMFGDAEMALAKGLGYCLMQDDTIVSEAFAGPCANGLIEIGVGTPEPYRGRGYATLTCAHLICACEARGYQTFWNTAQQNEASKALARKLGYRTEKVFRVVAWSKSG